MDLGQAFAAARRHWILLLVLTLVGLGGGIAIQVLTSPTYRSTSTVLFSLNRTGTVSELADGNSYVQDLVPSYVKVARMPIVLSPVIADLGLRTTPGQLADKVTVTVQPASVVAKIAVTDTDRKIAAAIANGIADQLVNALSTLSPNSASQSAVIDVTTLSPASPGNFPVSPSRSRNLGGGLLAGLLIGFLGVAVRESIVTQPLTTRAEIERVTDARVIGSIVADPRAGSRPLPMSTHPTIARSESFRILQTTLEGLRGDGAQCLVVVSSLPGEGRSGVAVNLAIALAHASRKVLLIDADLRKPALAQLLGVDNTRGLTTVLSTTSTLENSIQTWVTQTWGDQSLDVLPAGPQVSNPSELVASRAMSWVLEEVRKDYDVVVLDSPPLLQFTDGALLASQLDYAVMIVDAPRTRQRHLVESLSRLRLAGADVLGLVLNRTAPSSQLEYPVTQPMPARAGEIGPRNTAGHASAAGHSSVAGHASGPGRTAVADPGRPRPTFAPIVPIHETAAAANRSVLPKRPGSEPVTAPVTKLAEVKPAQAPPAKAEPVPAEPVTADKPAEAEPVKPEPAKPAAESGPVKPEQAPDPKPAEPADATPAKPKPVPEQAISKDETTPGDSRSTEPPTVQMPVKPPAS